MTSRLLCGVLTKSSCVNVDCLLRFWGNDRVAPDRVLCRRCGKVTCFGAADVRLYTIGSVIFAQHEVCVCVR